MKHSFRSGFLPVFPAVAGALGLFLRFWLFSAIDEKGLLPAGHFADTALYILTAVTLGILFLATRKLSFQPVFTGAAPAIGCVLGSIGFLYTAVRYLTGSPMRFSGVATAACFAGGLALLVMAVLRKKASFYAAATVTVCLILDTITQCQDWGITPQLQEYAFPLLASLFLILSAYHLTRITAGQGKPQLLVFFSQSALFFCCLCLNTQRWPLYLGMLVWAATQISPPQKEA